MKKLFAMATLAVAAMSVSAEVTPRSPIVPWGAQAEIIITNDLTTQDAQGKWRLTEDAQKWIVYERDGSFDSNNEVQQTNRNSVWFNIYAESDYTLDGKTYGCDDMIVAADHNWGGQTAVTSKTGEQTGLIVVGKTRAPHFYVTGTDKAKFYFYGSAGTVGYARIEVFEVGSTEPVMTLQGTKAQTKKTWSDGEVLIAEGLDKAKSYEFVAHTMALNTETNEYTYEGGDMVLQVVKFYGDQAPMREDGLIISGSEIGNYINQHLAAYPEVTDFTLEGSGRYTIKEGITAAGKFTLTGDKAAPATIDASALAAPFVQFATIADDAEKDANGFVAATSVKFANIKVNALGQSLFSSNKQNYLVPELTIDNSVIELTANPFLIDFRGGGVVAKMAVSNSTIWAATATSNSFYTGQSGKKATEAGLEEQIFSFTNNTLSNICFGKNFFTHRSSGQTWLTFEVKNNIIANCGKDNFLASLNGGQTSPNPKYIVEGNTFLKTVTTTNEDETTTTELSNINDLQSTSDETEEIVNPIAGVPFTLEKAVAGSFTVAASSQQAKFQTGDPRWLVPYATDAIKVEVDLAENTDWVKAVNDALAISEAPSSITVQFFEAGEYPTSAELNTNSPITIQNGSDIGAGEATIVVNNGMTLGGTIKIDGINLKAGDELAAPIITLQGNPYLLQDNGFYNMGSIQFKNLNIKSGKLQILYGNKVKNKINELLVENCVVDVDGCTKVPFDFNGGGAIGAFNIKKSTIWAANPTDQSLFSTQSGNKATEAGFTTQNLAIDNSTLYNIAKGKNFYTHRQSNQTWLAYYLRNSIFMNVGKSGQVVKGINGGQNGKNPAWTVSGNVFNFDGADTSAAESTGDADEPVQNNVVTTSATFAGLAEGNFDGKLLLSYDSYIPSAVGDPRWNVAIVPVVDVDYTAKVGVNKESWDGASGTAGSVTTSLGVTTPLVELYNSSSAGVKMSQKITGLPNGNYLVKVFATSHNARGEDGATLGAGLEEPVTANDVAYVFAETDEVVKTWITACGVAPGFLEGEQTNPYTIAVVKVTNGEMTVGLAVDKEKMTGWHTIQIHSLTRLLPLDEAWDALAASVDMEKKMSEAVKTQFEAAKSADLTLANYKTLQAAVANVLTSQNSYGIIAAGVMADNDLANWKCTTGNVFHVNTWSNEGNSDGSGMTTPFIEDWCNANDGFLGDGQIVCTLPFLDAAKYEVSALVRLYSEKGNTPEGASFFVGEQKETVAGTECTAGNAKGIYATMKVQGDVDAEGNLKFGVDVKNANFNWVAIKNITIKEIETPVGIETIATENTINNGVIYNLNGQKVNGALKGGLYIINGKKVVIK